MCILFILFFFFNDTATTEIYTLSLHDALPISKKRQLVADLKGASCGGAPIEEAGGHAGGSRSNRLVDRKSTRLNSSHGYISYAVFCLKKKKNNKRYMSMRSSTPPL